MLEKLIALISDDGDLDWNYVVPEDPPSDDPGTDIAHHVENVVQDAELERRGSMLGAAIMGDIDRSVTGDHHREITFAGGCDCPDNPNDCGAGHFCRWRR
jgi:hypothetical protein